MPLHVNVKLPLVGPADPEHPHLTRFQATAPPHLLTTTLLGLAVEPTTTVAQLKAKVAGARADGARTGRRAVGGDGVGREEKARGPEARWRGVGGGA